MSDILSLLGIDPDEFSWKDLALCAGMDTNLFYDEYESNNDVAKVIDEVCLSCPVMAQCLRNGIENNEWGVHGGVYLVSGKVDKNRNAHKSKETWDEIRKRIGDAAL